MSNILKNFIKNYTFLSDDEWKDIICSFTRKEYKRNEIILEPGKVCRHFYLFESGLVRFYNIINGEDITKTFTLAPYCFTSKTSFRKQIPSAEGIQAIEDTVVWEIAYSKYHYLENIDAWNVFMRKILHEIEEFSERFYLEAKTLTAEERYQKLFDDYPAGLLQNPTQTYFHLSWYCSTIIKQDQEKVHQNNKT